MEMRVDSVKLTQWSISNPHTRPPIQNAFPFLTPDEREFLITGITPTEWDEEMGEEED